ncbi:MAG: glutamyl-tRNA reductase [Gammaproteobacteria bacterium]
MSIIACGFNHETAPITLRERMAFNGDTLHQPLCKIINERKANEVVILSTCNRTEIYSDTSDPQQLLCWLAQERQLSFRDIQPFFYNHYEEAAIKHLMRVACGLDSMMLGEAQILGQVKQAYATAQAHGAVGPRFTQLFPRVFSLTKRVRSQTAIGENPISIAYAAVNLAKQIFTKLSTVNALLVGAGETIELVAQQLHQHQVKQLYICNRTLARAQSLAQRFQGQALPLSELGSYLPQADIVVTATSSQFPIIGKGALEKAIKIRKHAPMFMVDLAVPRDIEPEAAELPDVYLYNIDALQQVITDNLHQRRQAALHAEHLIDFEVMQWQRTQRAQGAAPLINAYRSQLTQLQAEVLAKAQQKLARGEVAADTMKWLAHTLTHKIMHTTSVELRALAEDGQDDALVIAKQLLGINE